MSRGANGKGSYKRGASGRGHGLRGRMTREEKGLSEEGKKTASLAPRTQEGGKFQSEGPLLGKTGMLHGKPPW